MYIHRLDQQVLRGLDHRQARTVCSRDGLREVVQRGASPTWVVPCRAAHLRGLPRRVLGRPFIEPMVWFVSTLGHTFARRNLKAFTITETLDKLMAAAAMIGESSRPVNG